jgi:outer membrane lipoprotein carrier protein
VGTRFRTSFAALLVAAAALASAGAAAGAGADTALDRYLADFKTLRVSFTQALTDGHGRETQSGHGTLVVQRPGRFRWEIKPAASEAGQLLVADGKNLWFYDQDLAQVTVKPSTAALSATPALLLSGGGDIRDSFAVSPLAPRGGLDWVRVKPLRADADFREARIGFQHGELVRMELADKLGQTATLLFDHAVRNGPVQSAETNFTVPAGVDLIGTPVH